MRYIIILALAYCFSFAFDINFDVKSHLVPNGKTALIEVYKQKGIDFKYASYDNKKFNIVDNPFDKTKMYLLIPFGYYEKYENKTIYIHYTKNNKNKKEKILLKVIDGKYKKESLSVSSSKVNPKSKEVKERISKEYKEAMKIYHTKTDKDYLNKPFILPMKSKITSEFGKARVYNGSLKGYHSGTDFRAKVGTPILCANDGKVVLVKNRFYSGGTVLVDHGNGIYTCYFHMSGFNVKKDDIVKRAQLLGLSGESGRVTGPHLHFSARINGVQVDPLQLETLMNNNILKGKNL
jgi:murein DD-endopeptidase MepM/ murein hydrolase activator NlpD